MYMLSTNISLYVNFKFYIFTYLNEVYKDVNEVYKDDVQLIKKTTLHVKKNHQIYHYL
jgi:hypothetical protein